MLMDWAAWVCYNEKEKRICLYCYKWRKKAIERGIFMLKEVIHIGLTVRDLDVSIHFYRDILGLNYEGEVIMEGPETDMLFNKKGTRVRLAYLNGGSIGSSPPIELIQFLSEECEQVPSALTKTSISEVCFRVDDIERSYQELSEKGIEFLSAPQFFDFSKQGFGKSKAVCFKDPDGIILELLSFDCSETHQY